MHAQAATAEPITNGAPFQPLGVVGGVDSPPQGKLKAKSKLFVWRVEHGARRNYRLLGRHLALRRNDLFRNPTDSQGLLHVLADGTVRPIVNGARLAPIIVDTLTMRVEKNSKTVGELPAAVHLNAMLKSECFLGQFRSVDRVSRYPMYEDNFSLVPRGYNQDGDGKCMLYVGPEPQVANGIDTINRFLDAMAFAGPADRTNTVGAALTVRLRHHWPGEKPVVAVTGTKSHSGKSTVTDFVKGTVPNADILYESIDWPLQSQFQRQLAANGDVGVIVLDNVRLDSAGGKARCIRSAFVESFVTTPHITIASPGAGEPIHLHNEFVVAINTNDGTLSPDLLNRSLPIHLAPKGNVDDRVSPIGNPKLEFLPANREQIEAELHGMIARWRQAGCPLDETIKHPMTRWARTIGGILKHNGFTGFLANYGTAKIVNDPTGEALGILAATKPGQKLKPLEWAKIVVELGLAKALISANERDTVKGRERAIGLLLKNHIDETFEAGTEAQRFLVRLEGGYRRWDQGKKPHTRYVFTVLTETPVPIEP
jgi:hypothetical protein